MIPLRGPDREALIERHGERFKWLALLVVGLGTIAGVLATTSLNVAVPAIGAHFGVGQDRVQWTITGFMAALAVAMLPTPWLLDRYGFRRLFLGANLWLALFSIAGFFCSNFHTLVLVRCLQGITAGLLTPLPMLAVMRLFPRGSQGRASGLLIFGIVLAPAVAPSLAGLLLERFGWQSIFWLNLPFCLIAGGMGLYLLPRAPETVRKPFDWHGVALLCAATLLIIDFITRLRQQGPLAPMTLGEVALIGACFWLFVHHARRAATPIVSPLLFAERSLSVGALVSLAYGLGLYASTYLIPVFMQQALGYDAALAGLALLPSGIVLALITPLAGWLADHYPPRWITVIGLAIFGASFVLFALGGVAMSYSALVVCTIVGRLGLGLVIPALSLAMLSPVRAELMGQASMVANYSRQVGGVLGVAIVAVFVEWRMALRGPAEAYVEAFALMAAVFACATLVALRMKPSEAAA